MLELLLSPQMLVLSITAFVILGLFVLFARLIDKPEEARQPEPSKQSAPIKKCGTTRNCHRTLYVINISDFSIQRKEAGSTSPSARTLHPASRHCCRLR